MSYLLLIVEPVGQRATRTEAEGRAAYDVMLKYADDLKRRGKLVIAQALSSERSRLQVRDGKAREIKPMDGPFAEAKEMVGGFFLLDNVTRDEALAIAAACPAAQFATVEVRELGPCFT
jgi:hypothetical protein